MLKVSRQKNKGLTLLFAVILSSLVLAVGASVISIALKQVKLSGTARDSQFAFYAANTGIECAMYWDLVGVDGESDVFSPPNDSFLPQDTNYSDDSRKNSVECIDTFFIDNTDNGDCDFSDSNNTWCHYENSDVEYISSFRLKFPSPYPYCFDVIVNKSLNNGDLVTQIESRGYNTCDETNPRRIERALRVTY